PTTSSDACSASSSPTAVAAGPSGGRPRSSRRIPPGATRCSSTNTSTPRPAKDSAPRIRRAGRRSSRRSSPSGRAHRRSERTMTDTALDTLCVNTIRTLAMDAVQQANSGHPGTPMAMAPVAYALWQRQLRFDPDDPIWPNRDRFVLSMGHASMLLYSLLHLTGVKAVSKDYETLGEPSVPLEEIKKFRQLDSKCPGHPEYRWTSGVETTTGPLGQGIATSVGMAIAGKWL